MTYDQITQTIRRERIGFTIAGYERAQDLLAEHHPTLSNLQRKSLAGALSKAAA